MNKIRKLRHIALFQFHLVNPVNPVDALELANLA
jgi:hypothetical protein